MIIYNTVDYPVIITVGETAYRMEKDSELELKIPSGQYYFRAYKLDYKGKAPMRIRHIYYRRRADVTFICLAVSGLLTVRRNTRIYLRETQSDDTLLSLSSERYKFETFDITLEDGEMESRRDGCLDDLTRKQVIRSFWTELITAMIGHLLLVGIGAALLIALGTAVREVQQSGAELPAFSLKDLGFLFESELIVFLIGPLVALGMIVYDLYKSRNLPTLKDLPILPEPSEYDYL